MEESKKISKTFTVDKNIFEKFREICDKNSINMSKFVQNKMNDLINDNETKKTTQNDIR